MQLNTIINGDFAEVLHQLPEGMIHLFVTDPPYLVNRDRSGRQFRNDNTPDGVLTVFEPLALAMKDHSYAICFAEQCALSQFTHAWDRAGLRIVSQIV